MVNRVELVFLDEAHQVRKFYCHDSAGFEQDFDSFDEIVDVRNLCQNVRTRNEIRLLSFGRKLTGQLLTKEFDQNDVDEAGAEASSSP